MIYLSKFLFIFSSALASHFRGGTIGWKYKGPSNKVVFDYNMNWVLNSGSTSSLRAQNILTSAITIITPTNNTVTRYPAENWESRKSFTEFNLPSLGPFKVYVQLGCQAHISLPVSDDDCDTVKCRWATAAEADSISNLLPNSHLDGNNCAIHFPATTGNGYTTGWYAVALTVEDFPVQTITINGKTYTPSTPITQIPLQFLVHVETMSGGCNEMPIFIHPTPSQNQFISVKATQSLHITILVTSKSEVVTIDISSPSGATITAMTKISADQWQRVITWTPGSSDSGSHFVCASAADINGKTSEKRCFEVMAWDTCDERFYTDNSVYSKCNSADYYCTCIPGFTGKHCETDIDECASDPCQHLGTCTDLINGYRCQCNQGFTGTHCEIDIDECISSPCQNGASCVDLAASYTCLCDDGFTGTHCETNIDECKSNPCRHGGSCVDLVNGFRCSCTAGYSGDICQIDIDECQSSPCFNGTCVDHVNGWSCACDYGFTGQLCQTEIDECQSSPCLHDGTCEDLIDGYICHCTNDSTGNNCETWIDHCSPTPCLNDGNCTNYLDGYTCSCSYPWFGDRCQNKELDVRQNCTDFLYTDCSCRIGKTKLPTQPSHRIPFGAVGFAQGLLLSVLAYILWNWQQSKSIENNKVENIIMVKEYQEKPENDQIFEDSESKPEENKQKPVSHGQGGCKCFIDHTGFDHFKRADKNMLHKFRCRHQAIDDLPKVPFRNAPDVRIGVTIGQLG